VPDDHGSVKSPLTEQRDGADRGYSHGRSVYVVHTKIRWEMICEIALAHKRKAFEEPLTASVRSHS
jgi:hypothetical protein